MQKSFILNKDLPTIELINYTKIFKKFVATDKISFKVEHGVIHGFIGPNGAGKTTSIKAMIGAYIPTSGKVKINGHRAGSVKANGLIGYIPERASFPRHLNTIDYLKAMGQLSGLKPKDAGFKAEEILRDLNMEVFSRKKPITFSSGMQKKILLAQSLITNPSILILDEPAANLDPTARKDLFDELIKLRNEGKTILISSHILAELERIVDEVTFVYKSKMIFSGKLDQRTSAITDIFLKSNNNLAVKKFVEKNYDYQIGGDIKTEMSIKDVSQKDRTKLIKKVMDIPKVVIETVRTNDLQSFYDKLIETAEQNPANKKTPDIIPTTNPFKKLWEHFLKIFPWLKLKMNWLVKKCHFKKKADRSKKGK